MFRSISTSREYFQLSNIMCLLQSLFGMNQPNLYSLNRSQDNIRLKPCRPSFLSAAFLQPLKNLTYPRGNICNLRQREILSQTNPWTAIKWNISPRFRNPGLPSHGIECRDGRTEDIASALHIQRTIIHGSVFWNCNGLSSLLLVTLQEIWENWGQGNTSKPSGPPPRGRVVSFKAHLILKGTIG